MLAVFQTMVSKSSNVAILEELLILSLVLDLEDLKGLHGRNHGPSRRHSYSKLHGHSPYSSSRHYYTLELGVP